MALALMEDQLLVLALGLGMGISAALGIPISGLAAVRFGRGNHLLEVLIRVAIFGVILVGVGEVIGASFGPLVRQHVTWFFGAVVAMFFFTPWAFGVFIRRKGSRHDR